MRIVDRATFLAMPEETVFAKYESLGNIGEICVKGETWTNDYWYQPLGNAIEAHDTGEFCDVAAAAEKGEPFKLDLDCQSRDGLFEDEQRFVVWDQDDVKQLVARLQRCVAPQSRPKPDADGYWLAYLIEGRTWFMVEVTDTLAWRTGSQSPHHVSQFSEWIGPYEKPTVKPDSANAGTQEPR